MLRSIHIRDYAIVEDLELDLGGGLTMLTGETGAGKSILVGALGLVLGDRADAGAVRDGAAKADVSAAFDVAAAASLGAWLAERDLDSDGECVVRRVVGREGRSRAYVNGAPVTLQMLRELGEQLVDIHGQHAHQSLLRRDFQRRIVDHIGRHAELLEAVAAAHGRWRELDGRLGELAAARADRDARLDMLQFQIGELEALGLAADEPTALETEQRRVAAAGRLVETASEALAVLTDDEPSVQARLGRVQRSLEACADADAGYGAVAALVAEAEIQVAEAAAQLRSHADSLELDPARRDWLEQRLATMQSLARKHRIEPAELPARLDALAAERDELVNADTRLETVRAELAAADAAYAEATAALTRGRGEAAKQVAAAVTASMQELGMPGGRFEVALDTDPARRSPEGCDRVEFLVSANPGQAPRPLAKVASGGELARMSLAIQVLAADVAPVATMIFDEVDAGIGGGVAEIVGRLLRSLATDRQVLCVTHLPQVASHAHRHLRVSKVTDGVTTRTELTPLDEADRVEELARMLGGVKITRRTRDHAREMISNAAS